MPETPPPATTADFEHLLDLKNVVAVEYDPADTTVRTWVSQKLSPSALDPSDNVTEHVDDAYDVDVIDVGYGEERDGFDPAIEDQLLDPNSRIDPATASERQQRHRPAQGGISECHHGSTAATGGMLAVVRDPSVGAWDERVPPGTLVRLSNCHVYAQSGQADFGDAILQPSPYDQGTGDDAIGVLAGYVPLDPDGTPVDVAARTANPAVDARGAFNLPDFATGVLRSGYQRLRDDGVRVAKGGRTTGQTEGEVTAVNATVNVGYGGDLGVVRMPNQILTTDMSEGGDSGSPVFVAGGDHALADEAGAFVGHIYAGGSSVSVVNKAGVIERTFGVTIMAESAETFSEQNVQVAMQSPRVSHVETHVPDAESDAAPRAGETAEIEVVVEASYQLPVWVRAVGPVGESEAEAVPTDDDEREDGRYECTVTLAVEAPAAYHREFDVVLTGGYRLTDEYLGGA